MTRNHRIWTLCVCLAACESREPAGIEHGIEHVAASTSAPIEGSESDEPRPTSNESASEPEPDAWAQALARRAEVVPTRESCPHMFLPSLTPVAAPQVQARNSARRIQRVRSKIARVEVIELSTNRVLFELDEQTLSSLREAPKHPRIDWDPNERPMVALKWEVGLLIHVGEDPVPFLGFLFHDDQLYFVDEADPWDPAVFEANEDEDEDEGKDEYKDEDENENFRAVYGIPVDPAVHMALQRRLGPPSFDVQQMMREEWAKEAARCGRVSAMHGDPFPELPAAVVGGP